MRDCFDISDDDLAMLVNKFDIEKKYRAEFTRAMSWAAFRYAMTKDIKKNLMKKSVARELDKCARAVIDAMKKMENVLQKIDNLPGTLDDNHGGIRLRRDVSKARKLITDDAGLWLEEAKRANIKFDSMGKLKKNIGNPSFNWLLKDLINAYEAAGKEVDRRSGDKPAEWYKETLPFIKTCFGLLGEKTTKPDSALRSAINNVINAKKKSKKSD